MSLSHLQSLRVAAVLEDCGDKLDILGHTLTVQMSREPQERARLAKLKRDCLHCWQQVQMLRSELEEKQSFLSLQQVVEEEEQRKKADNMWREAKRQLEQRKQSLQRHQEELQDKTEKLKDLCQLTKDLKRQISEQALEAVHRKKIVERETELQLQRIQKATSHAEKLQEDRLEVLQRRLKEEARVHEESEKHLQNQHEYGRIVLQQQLQEWQQRTKLLLQEKEEQVNSVRRRRTVNLDRLTEMRRKFQEMEEVLMEDRLEQEQLRHQQVEARAATKLQAWWRGCMVRRGHAGFKKADGGKKGKKSKDKKKKKK